MKLSLAFSLLSLATVLVSCQGTQSVNNQSSEPAKTGRKSFEEWCKEKDSLTEKMVKISDSRGYQPVSAKKTIEALLEQSGTQDCKLAESKLKSLLELNLTSKQITDVAPLASLTNLTTLDISRNGIIDVTPLASLTNLTNLGLSSNSISDIRPLASLTNLTVLGLVENQISDVKPLARLTKLTELYLEVNKITDVTPLASLTNLTKLTLGTNPIFPEKFCPLKKESVCDFK
ncbi:leucine-rich repeat domain-containing protein [Tumidithrix elongata RA019]|uniref:Leucine-rich repeat domain-containing protein n=1 Tax=Tumidithrix elongata BACA0141 TaxID=2716417 RepID=A0AAW9Q7I2_9CYAN|nr:leucine-rich repeat domain-containing protein [Tumidithrix elongata RA019]